MTLRHGPANGPVTPYTPPTFDELYRRIVRDLDAHRIAVGTLLLSIMRETVEALADRREERR